MSKIQEKFLLLKIQHQRDADAFTRLYELLAEPIYRFIFFKVSDSDTAKDLTSEVFIRVWRELTSERVANVKHLKAYVYRIARNIVIDHYRKKETIVIDTLIEEIEIPELVDNKTAKQVEIKIDSEKILKLMNKLKTSYQEILVLRYIEDLAITEIAHIISKSPVATRVLLHRANQALKREYEKVA